MCCPMAAGFEMPEIDLLLTDETAEHAPVMLPAEGAKPINRTGDAWSIGPHRLMRGSALDRASYAALLGGQKARLVFTDPPYNVPTTGHLSRLGQTRHREFARASGEMSEDAFTSFLRTAFGKPSFTKVGKWSRSSRRRLPLTKPSIGFKEPEEASCNWIAGGVGALDRAKWP